MARDINYSPDYGNSSLKDDGSNFIPYEDTYHIAYQWWCAKCLDYHYGLYECPYDDYDYCPHCGQLIKRANEGGWR